MEGADDGFERVRAARKEDGAAKDGRDGDTGRRFERVRGLRAGRKWQYDLEGADKWTLWAFSDIFTRIF